jgi:hypothetical protein
VETEKFYLTNAQEIADKLTAAANKAKDTVAGKA